MMANPPTDNDPFAKKQAVPAPFDPTPQPASPGERRIREALTHSLQTPLQYIETPLNQIASQLSDEYGIPIQFDGPALDSIAISPDVEVSLDVHDLPLKSALRLLLRQVTDLDYLVRDDVLLITTCDEADNWMETHVYDLGSLVERGDYDVAELQQMIRSCIAPEAWAKEAVRDGKPLYQPGGEISILGAQRLVIRQTQAGHEEIVALLKELDRRTAP